MGTTGTVARVDNIRTTPPRNNERYKIDSTVIAAGGFGKVRTGEDTELQRKIAVKTLDPVWAKADADDKERFRREARTLAKLSHPNIPAIYDVVFGPEHFEIIFQFVSGDNLRAILNSDKESIGLKDCSTAGISRFCAGRGFAGNPRASAWWWRQPTSAWRLC